MSLWFHSSWKTIKPVLYLFENWTYRIGNRKWLNCLLTLLLILNLIFPVCRILNTLSQTVILDVQIHENGIEFLLSHLCDKYKWNRRAISALKSYQFFRYLSGYFKEVRGRNRKSSWKSNFGLQAKGLSTLNIWKWSSSASNKQKKHLNRVPLLFWSNKI